MSPSPPGINGAQLIAQTLKSLEIPIVFGIVGIPIIEVAEACVAIGIRFVGFRNEQAASYAASAYGYLTGRPGVLLVVGGPGVVHALPGIHGAQTNLFPLLVLSGSAPSTHLATHGSFQSLQTTTFLAPHTKLSLRAPQAIQLPQAIREAYRTAFWGRPGAAAVEINGDFVTHKFDDVELEGLVTPDGRLAVTPVPGGPKVEGERGRVRQLAALLRGGAKRPLIVVGKGAAYARCEGILREFVESTSTPFLPTPMGKGLLPDNHPLDCSAARSTALANADLIILLGARLNWILHFGTAPKFAPGVTVAKIDISAEEIGRNLDLPGTSSPSSTGESIGIVGDCGAVLAQLLEELNTHPVPNINNRGQWLSHLTTSKHSSAQKLRPKLITPTPEGRKLTYQRTFHLLQETFSALSLTSTIPSTSATNADPGISDSIVYISEGANTMDISRSIFPITLPRQRLDAGTDATMGIGLGYAIAAWCAYNLPSTSTPHTRKKIIAIEGDSAFGFSAMEIETMARYNMDIIVVVVNNGGVYRGVDYSPPTSTSPSTTHLPPPTTPFTPPHPTTTTTPTDPFPHETHAWTTDPRRSSMTLPSTALSYRTRYARLADALGGKGFEVWGAGGAVERQLVDTVSEAWRWSDTNRMPVVIDVGIESGKPGELVFAWLAAEKAAGKGRAARL